MIRPQPHRGCVGTVRPVTWPAGNTRPLRRSWRREPLGCAAARSSLNPLSLSHAYPRRGLLRVEHAPSRAGRVRARTRARTRVGCTTDRVHLLPEIKVRPFTFTELPVWYCWMMWFAFDLALVGVDFNGSCSYYFKYLNWINCIHNIIKYQYLG